VTARIICGDALTALCDLPDQSVNTCVTSPPYWGLRDYGVDGQIGLEETPEAYVSRLVEVFREVRRVLRDDGTLWLNLGDSYASNSHTQSTPKAYGGRFGEAGGSGRSVVETERITVRRPDGWTTGLKPKDLVGIPWRVAFALQADGYYLRQDIIWHKPNPMPESVRDRCTKAHEYLFLLSKSPRYYYDKDAIREPYAETSAGRYKYAFGGGPAAVVTNNPAVGGAVPHTTQPNPEGRNKRDVWTVTTKSYPEAHFATFPPDLIRPCVRAGCPAGGLVLDPFAGAGTTGLVALEEGRDFLGIELNPEYVGLIEKRLAPLLAVATLDQFAEASA
jgi:DNA modification methylase